MPEAVAHSSHSQPFLGTAINTIWAKNRPNQDCVNRIMYLIRLCVNNCFQYMVLFKWVRTTHPRSPMAPSENGCRSTALVAEKEKNIKVYGNLLRLANTLRAGVSVQFLFLASLVSYQDPEWITPAPSTSILKGLETI